MMASEKNAEPAPVSQADIETYLRDGAVVIRQAMPDYWIDQVARGLEDIYQNPGPMTSRFSLGDGSGETLVDQYASQRNQTLEEVVKESPLAAIAGQLMGSQIAAYILDQVFYKQSGNMVPTAFHQDNPYLRIDGFDLARTWVCCDHSPPQATIGIVRGSHRWNVTYRPVEADGTDAMEQETGDAFSYNTAAFDHNLPPLPDIENHPDSFDILRWDMQPGDVLVFNGNAIHGTTDTYKLNNRRRAFAVLWAGDDARYLRRPGHSLPDLAEMNNRVIATGDLIRAHPEVFPALWQRTAS